MLLLFFAAFTGMGMESMVVNSRSLGEGIRAQEEAAANIVYTFVSSTDNPSAMQPKDKKVTRWLRGRIETAKRASQRRVVEHSQMLFKSAKKAAKKSMDAIGDGVMWIAPMSKDKIDMLTPDSRGLTAPDKVDIL